MEGSNELGDVLDNPLKCCLHSNSGREMQRVEKEFETGLQRVRVAFPHQSHAIINPSGWYLDVLSGRSVGVLSGLPDRIPSSKIRPLGPVVRTAESGDYEWRDRLDTGKMRSSVGGGYARRLPKTPSPPAVSGGTTHTESSRRFARRDRPSILQLDRLSISHPGLPTHTHH